MAGRDNAAADGFWILDTRGARCQAKTLCAIPTITALPLGRWRAGSSMRRVCTTRFLAAIRRTNSHHGDHLNLDFRAVVKLGDAARELGGSVLRKILSVNGIHAVKLFELGEVQAG